MPKAISKVKLIFIGVGGGRFVAERQYPPFYTGGFRIHTEKLKIHVDPGPGAVLRMAELGYKAEDTDVLIVSHNHMDHGSDANLIGEAMNAFGLEKLGVYVGSKNTVYEPHCNNIVLPYVANRFKATYFPAPDERLSFTHKGEGIEMKTTPIKHPEPTGWGFVMNIESKKIGYTSDTLYYEGLGARFKGVDVLIANVAKVKPSSWGQHLTVKGDFERLLAESQPKKMVVYHMGEEIIHYGRERLAKELKKAYEVKYDVDIYLPISGDIIEI